MLRIAPKAPIALLTAGLVHASASAQVPVTIVPGFAFQSWNAGTSTEGRIDWTPESLGAGWFNGLRWNWQTTDGMGDPVSPMVHPVFDPAVPGITGAYKFPEAKAASIDVGGTPRAAWENNAQPGEPGSFEIWFKPSDLTGTHVLWEIGATNKGVAFLLDDGDLVYAVQATDGAGGNIVTYEYRQPLTDTEWHQAVITIDLISFRITSYFDGQEVDNQSFTASATYRWASGNPAGLGMIGQDPAFPGSGVAGDPVDPASITDYDGWISTLRFYDVDLFANEVLDNYNALTNAAAADRRADFNGDGAADGTDAFDYVTFMTSTDTTPIADFSFPFPHNPTGGVQTNDPALDETFVGDFYWQRDDGFNPTSQEPTFQSPAINVLEPMPINDPAFPSIRRAFNLDGVEAFRGPKFEFADDTSAVHVLFWLYVDDLVGNHCLFEAGGDAVGFSMV
ncbi:MAG: LamG-like jellyroll fold domain-containing protein, partial [Phycisphaerales bacterium]